MLGCVSSAIATASSTESTLPKTWASGLVTGGVVVVEGGATSGVVCAGGGGRVGVCAAALVVATTRAAPASSNRRTRILISIAPLGPEDSPLGGCLDRGKAEDITRSSRPTQIGVASRESASNRAVDKRWASGGLRGNPRWTCFCLTTARYCVVDCPQPLDIGGVLACWSPAPPKPASAPSPPAASSASATCSPGRGSR